MLRNEQKPIRNDRANWEAKLREVWLNPTSLMGCRAFSFRAA